MKVSVLFEELLELGHSDAEYDAWPVRIFDGEQFSSGIVTVNPNSKIPAIVDHSDPELVRVFEPGSIVLHLAESHYLTGSEYMAADFTSWPWYGALARGRLYDAAEFLRVQAYPNVQRWADEIDARPAVKRSRVVNRVWGGPEEQLPERHDASDFEYRTQDKLDSLA